jgi:hypothetical protein
MAISIDGTGTISGVSVGGLPDGTVTPSDLSTGHPNWDSSGNVGIGTTVTTGQLNVSKSGGNQINVIDSSGSSPGIRFANSSNTALAFIEAPAGNGLSFFSGATERMRIDTNGNVLVGTTNTNSNTEDGLRLYGGAKYASFTRDGGSPLALVRRSSGGEIQEFFYNSTKVGTVSISTTNTSYNTSSDYRLKENVVEVSDGIDRVKLLKPSRFNFIADPDRTVDGFLAHEVADVVPEAIHGTKDQVDAEGNPEYQGIDQSKLVPLLTAALQEAITKIESLEARVATLEIAG